MKVFKRCSMLLLLMIFVGCGENRSPDDPREWTDDQVNEWFEAKEWLGASNMQPDPSIDKREFAINYHQDKNRWDAAFAFLKNEDLSNVKAGQHLLDGTDVFVKVTEYDSKNPEDVFYEAHKNYSDIQFVVSGMEYIGQSDISGAAVHTPYNDEKDIEFYQVANGKKMLAKPGTFFIFFPGDGHCPGMKVDENAPVKKMVIKVRSGGRN